MIKRNYFAVVYLFPLIAAACHHDYPPVSFSEADRPFVERTLNYYSGYGEVPMTKVNREVSPVVVRLSGLICVGLNPKQGVTGGPSTVCYDDKTGKPKIFYETNER